MLNHVLLHQTVIGQEAMAQLRLADAYPDVIVGCVGGGSNFGGLTFPFLRGTLRGENQIRYVAAEPAACPTLTRGVYAYDFGDTVGPDAADADVHARPRLRPAARSTRAACATTATRRW